MTLRLRGLFGIAISLALLAALVWEIDPARVLQALGRSRFEWLPFILLPLAADLAARTIRWHVILARPPRPGYRETFRYLVIGYLANNVLPVRLGELVRAHLLGTREEVGSRVEPDTGPQHRDGSGLDDVRLVECDLIDRLAESVGVVDPHPRDHGHRGVGDARSIPPAAEAHLEHGHLHAQVGEEPQRRAREQLELGELEALVASRGHRHPDGAGERELRRHAGHLHALGI